MRGARLFALMILMMVGLRPLAPAETTQTMKMLRAVQISQRPHDPGAYTQGLQLVDGILYESTGMYGKSMLRKVDPQTGRILRYVVIPPNEFGEGLTVVGDKVYMLTWREGIAHVFDRETLNEVKSFRYKGEGWGLTYDGRHLIMSDGSDRLTFRDPETFDAVSSITVTLNGLSLPMVNELEFVDGFIWGNVYRTKSLVKIDPKTGAVVAAVDIDDYLTPEEAKNADVLNGIAYDSETQSFLITGKLWPKLFEIVVLPGKAK